MTLINNSGVAAPKGGEAEIQLSAADISSLYSRARATSNRWGRLPIKDRLSHLSRLADLIVQEMEAVSNELSAITGKTPVEAVLTELVPTLEQIRYLEKHAGRILARERRKTPFAFKKSRSYMEYHPWGVALILSPWNFPLQLSLVPMATALAAGNAVILKPSEVTAAAGRLIADLVDRAGIPRDVVQIVNGDGKAGEELVRSRPDIIFLTGSVATGKKVMAAAAQNLTPVVLELGGKDPMIVFDDAPFERSVEGAVYGAFANAGQVCVSVERLYVQMGIYERFVKAVVERVKSLRIGMSRDHDIGAMTSRHQIDIVNEHIDDALKKGAVLQTERCVDGIFFHPVVLTGVNHQMKIMTEETFGPVLPIMAFSDEDEAVELANDSPFGLNASVWTWDLERGARVASRLETGSCAVNDVLKNIGNPFLSFGGVKNSGVGRYHGPEGLRAFSRPMAVMVNKGTDKKELNWFPYSSRLYENLRIYLNISFLNKPFWVKLRGVWGFIMADRWAQKTDGRDHGSKEK